MSATQTLQYAAVDALIALLPTANQLQARPAFGAAAGPVPDATVASFVGATSADLAVVVTDANALRAAAGTDSPLVSAGDVLRPALEAAARVLGTGVLGEAAVSDASALFADPDTVVFELIDNDQTAGWFAIRVRVNGSVSGSRFTHDSVAGKLGRINNVEMSLTVEIGRTRMSVRDVLALEPGAVIELDRSAGAPADVLLNGRLIAHGEIVVVDQDYAVRITRILDVADGLS
jgi:flagellar motor switch protein FliN